MGPPIDPTGEGSRGPPALTHPPVPGGDAIAHLGDGLGISSRVQPDGREFRLFPRHYYVWAFAPLPPNFVGFHAVSVPFHEVIHRFIG
jgi:hypothetical protein